MTARKLVDSPFRPDRSRGALAKLPSELDRFTGAEHHSCGVEQHLVLRGADLRFDDLDGEFCAAHKAGDAVPDRRGALVGVHGR